MQLSPEHYQRIDAVFSAALDLPPEKQNDFLADACNGDLELRRMVEKLLAAESVSEEVFDNRFDAVEMARDLFSDADADRRLGPYRLERIVADGGMGTVYAAHRVDAEYERRVAIKIIRRGFESDDTLHRFRIERQILASLEHPAIARLYDGGTTDDGRPYLVMEYIEGLPIDRYADEQALCVEERLELFRQVAGAVQYAHRNLLVHRDLKPDNVLVTPDGEVKLLDFGIAKLLEPGRFSETPVASATRTGQRPMSPLYASPEQVRSEAITTASDVYSLGVMLYELLAGRGPYGDVGPLPHEIEQAVCEREPERLTTAVARHPEATAVARARSSEPTELSRRLRGDLENIVAMALEKDPARRYPSVGELAEDLRRHLEARPILARRQTWPYLTAKFLRRHRISVTFVLVLLLLVAATVSFQVTQIAEERDRADEARGFFIDLLRQSRQFQDPGKVAGVRELLDRGAMQAEALASRPRFQAALFQDLGRLYLELGAWEEASRLVESAIELRRRDLGVDHVEVGRGLLHLGHLESLRADYDASRRSLGEALEIFQHRLGEDHPETASVLSRLGYIHSEQGDYDTADQMTRRAAEIFAEHPPDDPREETHLLDIRLDLSLKRGEFQTAETFARRVLEFRRRTFPDDHLEIVSAENNLGLTLYNLGRLADAEKHLEVSIERTRRFLPDSHPNNAIATGNLASVVTEQGRLREGEKTHREALALRLKIYDEGHPAVTWGLVELAWNLILQNRLDEAQTVLIPGLEGLAETLGKDNPFYARGVWRRGELSRRGGDLDAAAADFRASIAINETVSMDHPGALPAHLGLARVFRARNQLGDAASILRSARDRTRQAAPEHWQIHEIESELGDILLRLGQTEDGRALVRRGTEGLARVLAPGDPRLETATGRFESVGTAER